MDQLDITEDVTNNTSNASETRVAIPQDSRSESQVCFYLFKIDF